MSIQARPANGGTSRVHEDHDGASVPCRDAGPTIGLSPCAPCALCMDFPTCLEMGRCVRRPAFGYVKPRRMRQQVNCPGGNNAPERPPDPVPSPKRASDAPDHSEFLPHPDRT